MFGKACLVFGGLYPGEEVLAQIAGLLERARNASVPIFHVQHDGGPGHILAKGSMSWPRHAAVRTKVWRSDSRKTVQQRLHDRVFTRV